MAVTSSGVSYVFVLARLVSRVGAVWDGETHIMNCRMFDRLALFISTSLKVWKWFRPFSPARLGGTGPMMTNGDFQKLRGKSQVLLSAFQRENTLLQTKLPPPRLLPLHYPAWNIYEIFISERLVEVTICICICWDKKTTTWICILDTTAGKLYFTDMKSLFYNHWLYIIE